MKRWQTLALVAALLPAPALGAPAEKPADKPAEPAPPSAGTRATSAAAAIAPGALVHGTGHDMLGEPLTARRLALAEAVGLGMILGGGTTLALTGASRYLAGPSAGVAVAGFGLFFGSFAADLYGVLSPDSDAAGRRPVTAAGAESEIGYLRLAGPHVVEPDLLYQRVSLRAGHFRVTPSAWFALDGVGARYRVEGAYRLIGVTPGASGRGTSDHLDAVVGAFHHRSPEELFSRSSLEFGLDARYDLGHVGSTLQGSFVEFSAGYAAARIAYDVPSLPVPADFDSVLLARFGFGARFRGHARAGSQAVVYYDHRHDEIVGGLVSRGLGSGSAGRFGLDGRWFFTDRLGLSGRVEVGSAWLFGGSLVFRQEGPAFGGGSR